MKLKQIHRFLELKQACGLKSILIGIQINENNQLLNFETVFKVDQKNINIFCQQYFI